MVMPARAAVERSQAGPATNHILAGDIRGRAVVGWGGSVGGRVAVGAVGVPPRNCVPAHAGVVDVAHEEGDGEVDVQT